MGSYYTCLNSKQSKSKLELHVPLYIMLPHYFLHTYQSIIPLRFGACRRLPKSKFRVEMDYSL